MYFEFNSYGKSELITGDNLVSLEPYLEDISEMDLVKIAEKANELGMRDWVIENIRPHLSEYERWHHFPTEDNIFQALTEIENSDEVLKRIVNLTRDINRYPIPQSEFFESLEKWLRENPTADRYRIASEIIKNRGSRSRLSILEDLSLEKDRVKRFYNDAEFGVHLRSLD